MDNKLLNLPLDIFDLIQFLNYKNIVFYRFFMIDICINKK